MSGHLPSKDLVALPPEVLQDVAFELVPALANTSQPLVDLIHLLITCKYIHESLHHLACPALYADIFRKQFDPPSDTFVSNTSLSHELFLRYRAIRNLQGVSSTRSIRHLELDDFRQSLWTAIMMALENCGRNLQHLDLVDVSELCDTILSSLHSEPDVDIKALVLWLRVLTLKKDSFTRTRSRGQPFSKEIQQIIVSTLMENSSHPPDSSVDTEYGLPQSFILYSRRRCSGPLASSLAAFLIRFAWEDAGEKPMINECPVDREAAQFLGITECATQEDCGALQTCTPPGACAYKNVFHMANLVDPSVDSRLIFGACKPNTPFSGLWEGVYMVKSLCVP